MCRIINKPADELARQEYYMDKIRELALSKYKESGDYIYAYIRAFGCQMNSRDSETIEGMFDRMGIKRTSDEKIADYIVYNTCCVRENAENRMFGHLGYLKNYKRERPNTKIIIGGCMTQRGQAIEKIKSSYRHVDVIFGTFNIHRLPELIYMNYETGGMIIDIWEEHGEIIEGLPTTRESCFKASVNIMYGCDNYCSYCVVPYVRGHERSRRAEDVISEIQALAEDGVKEIMLLGQNVNSYGRGLSPSMSFAELLRIVDGIKGIERIRFMTSHPKDLSDELIDVMSSSRHICRHLHLPVQSGSNAVLEMMNRKYTRETYLKLIEKIKARIPGILITTDIIVGFPGETEADFEDTLSLVREAGFSNAYTFEYSPRKGTYAAEIGDPASPEIIKSRFAKLMAALGEISLSVNKSLIGTIRKVLIESVEIKSVEIKSVEIKSVETEGVEEPGVNNADAARTATGRTDNNCIVHCDAGEDHIGQIIDVMIDGCKTYYLTGRIINR